MADFYYADFETQNTVDIKALGAWIYSESPTLNPMCLAYTPDDGDGQIWAPRKHGWECPPELRAHIEAGKPLVCHYASFECAVFNNAMVPRFGWPKPRYDQYVCTAAQGASLALPRSLEEMASVVFTDVRKDTEGAAIMRRMCIPKGYDKFGNPIYEDTPELFERLCAYCLQDTYVSRRLHKTLRKLPEIEQKLYALDLEINERGVRIDLDFIENCQNVITDTVSTLTGEMFIATKGQVAAPTSVQQIKAWLESQGIEVSSLDKTAIEKMLADEGLDETVRQILEIRRDGGKSSTAKVKAFADRTSADGRSRHALVFHLASTGRWGGAGIQLHNLPKGIKLPKAVKRGALKSLLAGDSAEWINALWGAPLMMVSENLRSAMIAEQGNKLIWADFNAIEARVLAWLANQVDLLELFHSGGDPYRAMASSIYALPADSFGKESLERQLGKKVVLGAGYQLGWKKFRDSCALEKPPIVLTNKESAKIIKTYRDANQNIVELWADLEQACMDAVLQPGTSTHAAGGKITFKVKGAFLWMRLPSGRCLAYARPSVKPHTIQFETEDGEVKSMTKDTVHYWGKVKVGSRDIWTEATLYGGSLTENACQSVARDLLRDALFRLEAAGYPVVLTIHDEVISEVAEGYGSVEEYETIMAETPAWAAGCPVKAEGASGPRYGK